MLFDEPTLQKINQLTLSATRVRSGMLKGDRRSTKRGSSIEFADYRDYVKGDDLRRLDWNIYARLDRPFIKLLEEEEDLAVHVLVDTSNSMVWGQGDLQKILYALRLAGGIGAIALSSGDRLTLSTLQVGSLSQQFGPIRGQQNLLRMFAFLEQILKDIEKTTKGTDLNQNLKTYALEAKRPGLAFILSDFFSPTGFEKGLSDLTGRGYEVTALHILTPDELDPPLAGDLSLIDSETNQYQEVSIDGSIRESYKHRVRAWQDENRRYCQQRGVRYLSISTAQSWDKVIFYDLRRSGAIR